MARILIADDDALIAEYVYHKFVQLGHVVTVADSGDEALSMLPSAQPDVIILDNLMPGLRGIEVLGKLRKDRATADIPVIMLTANVGLTPVIEAYSAGVTDYMTKPFEADCLVQRVTGLIPQMEDGQPSTNRPSDCNPL